jgi:FKBP-type peptidyl-prolyl cis-trans isomerase SlpA
MSEIIASNAQVIGELSEVTLHFSLLLKSGEEIDSTRNGSPATFTVGDGNLLPGFEGALLGKAAGFSEQIELPAADAFGERNEKNVQLIDRGKFAHVDEPLAVGLMVSFQAPDGELPGVVQDVYERTVKVDFNHPLSGLTIVFDVAILNVTNSPR